MPAPRPNPRLFGLGALLALAMFAAATALAGDQVVLLPLGAARALAAASPHSDVPSPPRRASTSYRRPPVARERAGQSLAWPSEGEAAVEVERVGRLVVSGAQVPVPIASVAKVMTAYLTLRRDPLPRGRYGFTLEVTAADVQDEQQRAALGESVLPVVAGEHLSERQALQALMLPSANNVAQMLAAHEAGSVDAFVRRMNATAGRLGMTATTYTDPSGYSASTVSTAADQVRLAVVAMRRRAFAQIVDESAAVLPVAGTVFNYNQLLGRGGYVGVKTGSDGAAGGCLVFAKRVLVGDRRLTVVGDVLGQREGSYIPAALSAGRRLGDSAAAALRAGMSVPAGAAAVVGRRLALLL
jgi:D-alanyl-D-alanine carboxypeptidase (penicillin-binding protein 5/6)